MLSGQRPRVLHFISSSGPHPYLCNLADHADREAFEITVGALGPPGELQQRLSARGLASFAMNVTKRDQWPVAALRLARRLRRQGVDVLQVHLPEATFVGLAAGTLAGTPLRILTGHHSHELLLYGRGWRLVDRACAAWLSDSIIAPSHDMRAQYLAAHGLPGSKVEVIPYGLCLDDFAAVTDDGGKLRRELGLEETTLLGAVGRIWWVKNYEVLLQALAEVRIQHPQLALVIAGAGDPAPLLELSRRLGVDRAVRFLGHREDVAAVLAGIDLFVHPAVAESFGIVVAEAMAAARPVVSAPVGAAPELIDPGRSGFLTTDASRAALARGLGTALAARDRWSAIGAAARDRVLPLRPECTAAAYEAHYSRWLPHP